MGINILINSDKKIIGYYGIDIEMKMVDDIPQEPLAVVGKNNVAYYNPSTQKIEWRQEDRPLTQEEKMDINTKSIQDLNIAMSEMIAG